MTPLFTPLLVSHQPLTGGAYSDNPCLPLFRIAQNRRAQLKVQEMAFVLVALILFFALLALAYLSFRGSLLKEDARTASDERALEAVRQLAATPEFAWAECRGCIDLDKVMVLKERLARNATLQQLWNYDDLVIESIYPPHGGGECTAANYPACNRTTLIAQPGYGVSVSAFVTLCRWEPEQQRVCELGKLTLSEDGRERAS